MCLTIPKKVIKKEGDFFVLENQKGDRQKAQSIVDLELGDYCFTQGGIAVEKIEKEEAQELINIFNIN